MQAKYCEKLMCTTVCIHKKDAAKVLVRQQKVHTQVLYVVKGNTVRLFAPEVVSTASVFTIMLSKACGCELTSGANTRWCNFAPQMLARLHVVSVHGSRLPIELHTNATACDAAYCFYPGAISLINCAQERLLLFIVY